MSDYASVPLYVRRISDTQFEYGVVRTDHDHTSEQKHRYEKRGTEKSLEEAMVAAGMEVTHEAKQQP